MSDEENKMLEIFKKEVEKEQNEYEQVNEYTKFYYNNHKFILNLIEKQSKEIEELKENECVYKDTSSCTKALSFKTYKKLNDIDKKWEDKIKAKIEELEKGNKNTFIRGEKILVLQSLLEKE